MAMEKGDLGKLWLTQPLTQPQPRPSNPPAGSFSHSYQLSHCFPHVLQRPIFPFQTHLAQDELNFLDPPP